MTAPALIFDDEHHAYTLGGRTLPSVTTVLTALGIVDISGIPAHRLEFGRQRGTAAHLAIRFANEGRLDAASLDAMIEPYLFAWERFCSSTYGDFTPELVEVPLCDATRGFAGTPDVVGPMQGQRTVIDVKVGAYRAGYAVQTAGYKLLCQANGTLVAARVVVCLHADGTFKVHPSTDRMDEHEFLAALLCYQRRAQRGDA